MRQGRAEARKCARHARFDEGAEDATDPRRLERFLTGLGRRGLHPFLGARLGLVGNELVFEDGDGRTRVKLVPLGDPTADVQTSADVVEREETLPFARRR